MRGRVSRGRLVVDEQTPLPDGEVELVVLDDTARDDVCPPELDDVLEERLAHPDRGELVDARESLARIRAR